MEFQAKKITTKFDKVKTNLTDAKGSIGFVTSAVKMCGKALYSRMICADREERNRARRSSSETIKEVFSFANPIDLDDLGRI